MKHARCVVATAVTMVIAMTATTPAAHADPSEQEIQAAVVDTCQGSVKKQLKDADSAKFQDWKAWVVTHHDAPPRVSNYHPENGDKLYSAGGDVNAKNSYGGYVGYQAYGCDAAVTTGGDVHAVAYSIEDLINGSS